MMKPTKPENYNGDLKRCTNCSEWKHITAYRSRGTHHSNHCRECEARIGREKRAQRGLQKTGRKPMEISNNVRTCIDCKEEKTLSEFPTVGPAKTKNGCMPVKARCHICEAIYRREYRLANPEKRQREDRKQALRRYGLTIEDYEAMLERQEGLCAICGEPERALSHDRSKVKLLAVDHCHDEDHIRGLLCQDCNTALGLFKDNIGRLFAAADYLAAGGVNSVGVGL